MSGFTVDVNDIPTPTSDCSNYSPNMLYLGAQPGTATSAHGGQWEAAVEGTQNFADFSDHGDLGQDSDEHSYQKQQQQQQHQQQQRQPTAAAQCRPQRQEAKWMAPGSVPMRRTVSKSSAGSFKSRTIRATAHKSRPRIHTDLSVPAYAAAPASAMPVAASVAVYGMAAPSYNAYYNGMSPDQYLAMYGQGLGPAVYSTSGGSMHYGTELVSGLGQHMHCQAQPQHVNPTCTQMTMDGFDQLDGLESLNGLDTMAFENSPTPASPQTWGSSSSRRSSPDRGEDTWSLPMAASPAESHDSAASLSFAAQLEAATTGRQGSEPSNTMAGSGGSNDACVKSEDNGLASTFQKRPSSDGESARDHPLYKAAACQPDGFYHCPWEGTDNCSHKPEKLKCNYDKFVDSHLKPYRCKHSACENARFSSTACLLRHEREAHAMHGHGDKPFLCPHSECDRATPGCGFPRQWNLKDHMRRVHHDDGKQLDTMAAMEAAVVAPVAVSSSQAVSKGRKRKKDAATAASSSPRKASASRASQSSQEAERRREAEAMAKAHQAAIEKTKAEWHQHQQALSAVVQGFVDPEDPSLLDQLQAAQAHMDAISRISSELVAASQDPFGRAFPQQSG